MDYIYKLQTRRKCMQDKFSIGCNNVIFCSQWSEDNNDSSFFLFSFIAAYNAKINYSKRCISDVMNFRNDVKLITIFSEQSETWEN